MEGFLKSGVQPEGETPPVTRRLLHAGCGDAVLPEWLDLGVEEVRLDINPVVKPHIIASMTDMGEIGEFDIVYSCHSLEHLYPHEVGPALGEFFRVLKSGGLAIIMVPDLENVKATNEILLETLAGQIAGLDLIYGCRKLIKDNPAMAHHSGFVTETLRADLINAGFSDVKVTRMGTYNLWGIGKRP